MLFATTNGTMLNDEMKKWFHEHRDTFYLGLSIDGTADVHNHNRSGSFDSIDTKFFADNWPEQGVKMTISKYSIPRLAESVKYIHSLGFQKVRGVNLAEGNFDWDEEGVVRELVHQLKKLIALFAAELQAQKIIRNSKIYDESKTYYTIKAIENIRALYYDEFKAYGL